MMPTSVRFLLPVGQLEPTVVAQIGAIALPSRGHVLGVALVDWGNDFGMGIDVRVFVTDAAHDRKREARARATTAGRRWRERTTRGVLHWADTRQGVLLQTSAAEELAEVSARAVVKAEAFADPADDPRIGRAAAGSPAPADAEPTGIA